MVDGVSVGRGDHHVPHEMRSMKRQAALLITVKATCHQWNSL